MKHALPPDACTLLKCLQRKSDDLVLPWHLTQPSLFDHFGMILKRAGLPHGRRDKFQRLRRMVASFLTAAGGNASLCLGPSSQQITQQNYLDPVISGVKGPAALLFNSAQERKKGGADHA